MKRERSTKGVITAALAKYLDLSHRRVQQLADEKILPRLPNGNFDLDACRVAYIRYLRDEGRRVSKTAAASRTQELRGDEIELRLARERGKLIEFEEVELFITDITAALSAELSGVPAGCTRDLDLRKTIEERQHAAIDRCRRRFEEASEALRAGREIFDDDEETNTGRLGED
jgi:phage terminase Nu1 subunit (DNA packaging protein)